MRYAATLHDFGPDTVPVLGALIAGLLPADRLHPPRRAMSRRVATIPVPIHGPVSVVEGVGGKVWAAGQGDTGSFAAPGESHRPSLVRIDPERRRVVGEPVQIHFAARTVAITNGAGMLWVAHRAAESRPLRLFDGSARLLGSLSGRPEAVAVAVGPDAAWVVDFGGRPESRGYRSGIVRRMDTGVVKRFSVSIPVGRAPAGIAADGSGVWVSNERDDTVTRINPRTNRVVETIRVGDGPIGVAVAKGAVWVVNGRDGTVSRIDARTNRVVATIRVGRRPRGIAGGSLSLWVTNELDDTVSRINPATNEVVETIPVGAGPAGVAVGAGGVWVANNLDQTVTRIEP